MAGKSFRRALQKLFGLGNRSRTSESSPEVESDRNHGTQNDYLNRDAAVGGKLDSVFDNVIAPLTVLSPVLEERNDLFNEALDLEQTYHDINEIERINAAKSVRMAQQV